MDTDKIYNYEYESQNNKNFSQSQKIFPVHITNALKKRFNLPVKSNTSYLSNQAKKKNQAFAGKVMSPKSSAKNKLSNNMTNSKIMTEDSRQDIYSIRSGASNIFPNKQIISNQPNSNLNLNNDNKAIFSKTSSSKLRTPSNNYSSRCHKYHCDLNLNYLAEKNFYNCDDNVLKRNHSSDKIKKKPLTGNFLQQKGNESNLNFYLSNTVYSKDTNLERTNKGRYKDNMKSNFNSHSNDRKQQSQGVLSELLDSQFAINSPSKKKIFQNEMDLLKSDEFRQQKLNKESNKDKIYLDEDPNNKNSINLSFVGESPHIKLIEALENIMILLDPIFDRLTLGEKIEKFLENTNDTRRVIK